MYRPWEFRRERIAAWRVLVERCRVKLAEARKDLGQDLGGFSAVDLLLDNFPELHSVHEAQNALDYAEGRRTVEGKQIYKARCYRIVFKHDNGSEDTTSYPEMFRAQAEAKVQELNRGLSLQAGEYQIR